MKEVILALDQGTTSSRALLFSSEGEVLANAQHPITQSYPKPGWVEHDPLEILASQFRSMRECLEIAKVKAAQILAIGICNQRETVVVWDRKTGEPIYPAIVWQCRRTASHCEGLKAQGLGPLIEERTGLRIDAYFSATKIAWILDHVPNARKRAEDGELLCGTIDSWLIWTLSGGEAHVSDHSNCSRTMLFDIHKLSWDEALCRALRIPSSMLPTPVGSSMEYARVAGGIAGLEAFAGIPISAAAGDQQAALFGQSCFEEGELKNTYGTGCFALMNTGKHVVSSTQGLLSSVAWSIGKETLYTLEGSVFNAGSAIQWLRDELGLIESAPECDRLAATVPDSGGVYFVPALTGLGAPHWDMYARGTIVGLTRGSTRAQLCRAALEGIAFQTAELIRAMEQDAGESIASLRVDGGASVSDPMMQFQADLLQIPVERPAMIESSAWGAACLAGLAAGVWSDLDTLKNKRSIARIFHPAAQKEREYSFWKKAVKRALSWEEV